MAPTLALLQALDLDDLDDLEAADLASLPDERAVELFAPAEIVVGAPTPRFTARAFDGPQVRGVSLVLGGDALELASVVSVRAWNGGDADRKRARRVTPERVGSRVWVRLPSLTIAPSDPVPTPLFDHGVASLADYRRAVRARASGELSFEVELEAQGPGVADLVVTLHALDGTALDAAPGYVPVRVERHAR